MERRTFIIGAVAGGIGLAEYLYVSNYMNSMLDPHALSVAGYQRYGAQAALVAITANDDFYITSKGGLPPLHASSWQLHFAGLVENPFSLNYAQLTALPAFERVMTLECISNPSGGNAIGNARWKGTALKPLIERARPQAKAAYAVISAADGFSTAHPIERVWNEANFLAYQMNGDDLPPVHGYPVRVFIPGKFGMKQPKWLQKIEFTDKPYKGYWESQGWSDTCERNAQARFTDLRSGAKLTGRNIELQGYAIGNLDGIRGVELSFDGGQSWKAADLFSNPSPIVWSFWRYNWINPAPGAYKIRVRATDGKGNVEGYNPRNIFPDGATGQQQLSVTVV